MILVFAGSIATVLVKMLDVYQINFAGLLGLCGILFAASRKSTKSNVKGQGVSKTASKKASTNPEASQWTFLVVFALVMGADWLQVSTSTPLGSSRDANHLKGSVLVLAL